MATILVVDDESSARTTLGLLLRKRSHRVTEVDGVAAAVKALTDVGFDVIVTDLRMPDGDGLDVLRAARAHCPEADVILLTAYAGWESAKEAIQLGACDYFEKGHEPDELLHRIDKALAEKALRRENANLRSQVQNRYALPGLVTGSARMAQVLDLIRRVAPTDATVLIHGESGSGKEVVAKAIHHASQRARGSFVAPRVGALRPRQGGLHGRGHEQEGAVRGSAWRDALARRDRRDAAEPAGQAPPHAPERRGPARRLDTGHHHRRTCRRRHEP
jgi:DNA-binding NtrC family response regulator